MEGFGQTECMGPIVSSVDQRRVGSVGKAMPGVEVRISDDDELQVRADGCSPGLLQNARKKLPKLLLTVGFTPATR